MIFEDTDGDGGFDGSAVFTGRAEPLLAGIEVGFGGVWVGAARRTCCSSAADEKTDKAGGAEDSPRRLEPIRTPAKRSTASSWGPDGWPCMVVMVCSHNSRVGKARHAGHAGRGSPSTPGCWRYYPHQACILSVCLRHIEPVGI